MKPREALRLALRDFYANSFRLVLVNAALGAILVASVLAALAFPLAAALVLASGPVAAALVHCAVTLVRTGNLALADAWTGLRIHWRRGLELAAAGAALVGLGIVAYRFYGASSLWPLAFLTVYVLVLLGIYELVLWTLAIAEPERGLRGAARAAAVLVASRPGATLLLGLALLLVNVVGIAAAVMPFLTLTVAYTFLATAHFVLPLPSTEETA
ncbi:MAG: hypothetical protein E6G20_00370 [Actinobacteria bacterium]|nr:MAG: hypothetical protein E6G20_00370 [Actinomycetota bacterium]